jgi:hypothetical protein
LWCAFCYAANQGIAKGKPTSRSKVLPSKQQHQLSKFFAHNGHGRLLDPVAVFLFQPSHFAVVCGVCR